MHRVAHGFLEAQYGATEPSSSGVVITLNPGQQLSDLSLALVPQAIVSGKVVDEDGDPVAGLMVRTMSARGCQHLADSRNEFAGCFDCVNGLLRLDLGNGSGIVIGNGFEVVGTGQKAALLHCKTRVILGKAQKFDIHTSMALEYLADAFKDQCLRGMKRRKVSGAARILVKAGCNHRLTALQVIGGILQKVFRLRRHRSNPSRRISYMRGEGSR